MSSPSTRGGGRRESLGHQNPPFYFSGAHARPESLRPHSVRGGHSQQLRLSGSRGEMRWRPATGLGPGEAGGRGRP